MRCQFVLLRRSDGTNCGAPSRLWTVTLTISTETGALNALRLRAVSQVLFVTLPDRVPSA